VKAEIMLTAIRRFLAEGYLFIGLDHFARDGDELAKALADRSLRRNFMGHTTQAGVDLFGFGPSAISELRSSYAQSHREVPAWEQAVRERGVATMRGHRLSRADTERRWIINRILCHGELRAREFEDTFGRVFAETYRAELATLAPAREDGLVEIGADGSLRTTPIGRLLVRTVAMAFDAYLPEQQKRGQRIFSKTV
jgi:oxygen-independent coproporphyrinogen-3 oxidase